MKQFFSIALIYSSLWIMAFASSANIDEPAVEVPSKPVIVTPNKPQTGLVILNEYYARDAQNAYVINNKKNAWISMNAHVESFAVLAGRYARDVSNVYFEGRVLSGADPKTFVIINTQYGYAQDKDFVYGPNGIIPEADPQTFALLTNNYSIDAGHAFYNGKLISEADAGSFRVLDDSPYASDDTSLFYEGKIIPDISPLGFTAKGIEGYTADGRVLRAGIITQSSSITTPLSSNILASFVDRVSQLTLQAPLVWTIIAFGCMAIFSLIFIIFARRDDLYIAYFASIAHTIVASLVGVIMTWIFARWISLPSALIIGAICAIIVFVYRWKTLGTVKSIIISTLSILNFIWIIGVGLIILRAIFGNLDMFASVMSLPISKQIIVTGIIGIFFGAWCVNTQLKSGVFYSLFQSFISTLVSILLLGLFLWMGELHPMIFVLLFAIFYGAILWIMRFRHAEKLFFESVRVVRVALLLLVMLMVVMIFI